MLSRYILRAALVTPVLMVAGCQEMDPYTRPDTWQPTGANAGNIAVMVANPYDLIRGRGAAAVDSKASGQAIGRVWTDMPKALLDPGSSAAAGASGSGTGSSSSGAGGGGSSSGGGSSGSGG